MIGVRKYMCTECFMFGYRLRGSSATGIREHSIEVSDDLLEQYIALDQPALIDVMLEKRRGPKPGISRMREYEECAHSWVPAPEYSTEHFPRLRCTLCTRIGRKLLTGDIVPFGEHYAGSLRRIQTHKEHPEGEPLCEHEWELVPQLGTKHINRYECRKCEWLGYRMGTKASIRAHTMFSINRIRSENGLRKEPDVEGTKEEIHQEQESSQTFEEGSTEVRGTDRREDGMGEQSNMRG